jgi:predicted nucleic acid-binding protein
VILDSTFLVDLEREERRKVAGGATAFLESRPAERLAITFTIAGELAAGATLGANRDAWRQFLQGFRSYGYTEEVGWRFGAVYRTLRDGGCLIGANDMWIAATALAWDEALVTRNVAEFRRVSGLRVFGY